MIYDITIAGKDYRLELEHAAGKWLCNLDGEQIPVDAVLARPNVISLLIAGRAYEIKREPSPGGLHLWVGSTRYTAEVRDPRSFQGRKARGAAEHGPKKVVAPMPGKVVRILVAEKSEVKAGQGILVVEAMKMQNEIKSPKNGVLQKLLTAEGASLTAGDVLAIVE
jgi:biotin carboxyl carrier protein